MKNVLLFLFLACLLFSQVSCDNRRVGESAQATVSNKLPKITFAETGVHDFGTITEGDSVEHVFKFTNTGGFPLIVNNVTASCGCTTPEWPREPVKPGQKSFVRVKFNSRNKMGQQNKTVTIYANTDPAMTDLAFRVLVDPKK